MKKYIPLVITLALFMETLDTTIITTAIPKMAISLGTEPLSLKIALTSYLLSLAIFIPVSGWFADRFGTKRVFIAAFSVFTIGSLLCGLAVNLETLVLARIFQGIGGAFMMPVGRLILIKTFPKSELIRMTNVITIPAAIAPILGPVVAGFIVSYMSWRWIFFINIPFGIAAIILAMKIMDNAINSEVKKIDYIGFLLFGFGLAGFAFVFESVGENTFAWTELLSIAFLSLGLLLFYFIRSKRVQFPFLDLDIFQIRTFKITVLGSFLSRCALGGVLFLLPLFFQLGLMKTPLLSGFLLIPYAIAMLSMKFFVKPILKNLGFKRTFIINTVLTSLSVFSFSFIDTTTSFYLIIILTCINGFLASLQFSCINVLTYVDVTEKYTSQATSIASVVQQLSMSFGIVIAALLLRFLSTHHLAAFYISPIIFHQTFLGIGLIILLTTAVFFLLNKEDGASACGRG